MKRRLIQQAGRALTVTLPIEWLRHNNLSAGDEIELDLLENNILIRSGKKVRGGNLKLKLAGHPPRLQFLFLNAAYARGIDEVSLETKGFTPGLDQNIGYALISQQPDELIIRDVSGISSQNLDEVFKRVFQMLMAFLDAAYEGIFGNRKETIENVQKQDYEINKFVLFLERAIMKHRLPDDAEGKILFAYSYALETIGDEILRAWRVRINHPLKHNKKIRDIAEFSRETLHLAFDLYYHTTPERVAELMKLREKIRSTAATMKTLDTWSAELLMHLLKISEDAYDITHLALLRSLGKETQ